MAERMLTITDSRTVATPPPEPGFHLAFRDWERFSARLKAVKEPEKFAANLGWTCVGVALSGVFGLILWLVSWMQMDPVTHQTFVWVWPVTVGLLVACGIVAWVSFRFDAVMATVRTNRPSEVCEDIDAIAERYRQIQAPDTEHQVNQDEARTLDPDDIPF